MRILLFLLLFYTNAHAQVFADRNFIGIIVSPDLVSETKIKPFYDSLVISNIWRVEARGTLPSVRYTAGLRFGGEIIGRGFAWELGLEFSDKGSFAQYLRKPGGWHFSRYFLDIPAKVNLSFPVKQVMICAGFGAAFHIQLSRGIRPFSISYFMTTGIRYDFGEVAFFKADIGFKYGRNNTPSFQGYNVFNRRWSLGLNLSFYFYVS